jgi:hypothetical protein
MFPGQHSPVTRLPTGMLPPTPEFLLCYAFDHGLHSAKPCCLPGLSGGPAVPRCTAGSEVIIPGDLQGSMTARNLKV